MSESKVEKQTVPVIQPAIEKNEANKQLVEFIEKESKKAAVTNLNESEGEKKIDLFDACEERSNFISKNNCKWDVCAKAELKTKPECDMYQRKDSLHQ